MTKRSRQDSDRTELLGFGRTPARCTSLALRQASRAVTQMYDQTLAPAGLSIGQYSLLTTLYYARSLPVTKLAAMLQMDRTSLTRTLNPLERDGLIVIQASVGDRRTRLISLTAEGLNRLSTARPLWQRAQDAMAERMGARLAQLEDLLSQVSEAAQLPSGPAPRAARDPTETL